MLEKSANWFLNAAQETIGERGKQYDKAGEERSMARTVAAFNALTGADMPVADGWLFMCLLKHVRQRQAPEFHLDSALDGVAYAALLAEELSKNNGGVDHADQTGK